MDETKHMLRLLAMIEPKQQTWDLSPNDVEAIRWAVRQMNDMSSLLTTAYKALECRGTVHKAWFQAARKYTE